MNKKLFSNNIIFIKKNFLSLFLLSTTCFLTIFILHFVNYNFYSKKRQINDLIDNKVVLIVSINKKLLSNDIFLIIKDYDKYSRFLSIYQEILNKLDIMYKDENIYNFYKHIRKSSIKFSKFNNDCKWSRVNNFVIAEYFLSNKQICSQYLNFVIDKITNSYEKNEKLKLNFTEEERNYFKKKQLYFAFNETIIENQKLRTFKEYLIAKGNQFILFTFLISISMSFITILVFNNNTKKT
jgi:hypothetical protein